MDQDDYKCILDNLFDGVYFVNAKRVITYWNHGAERISGFSAQDVVGKGCADGILRHITGSGEELCTRLCPLAKTLVDGEPREDEVFLHHKNGHRVPVSVRIAPLRDKDGAIIGAVEVFSDATPQQRLREEVNELRSLAMTDQLTGLGNRAAAGRQFKRRMSECKRFGVPFGLLFADIDHFKKVNDTYGHDTGDCVLAQIAKTLKSSLRGVDALCRWGGEEFVALVPKVDEKAFHSIAERMRRFVEATSIPSGCGHPPLRFTISVGGALARPDDTLTSLAARADTMMYEAKRSGRNCIRLDCNCEAAGEDSAD
ncbi:PAS domain S-box-containing protein/diguanylate cyclase (GGDEF) domain-containing protein [Humidesulfovibrio mexicanus]|uniref:PAS domain S-box-containing protein/diguanylate cyclase (GGDEF) domain-containing protein n=1 Tax=Humidesulfovibrio mexicanus TaxID=147047 RepID=A0A238XYB7_9BACT|nr:sensor domain-containing diguanylate cyclase [Humidesulfovibrio mexicanus]SNR63975.1 PAS domain S-box-containing protein/diguanylate cyclase (GGDEF) domain-containing protein [Humidesulfovibrio mexicanus]